MFKIIKNRKTNNTLDLDFYTNIETTIWLIERKRSGDSNRKAKVLEFNFNIIQKSISTFSVLPTNNQVRSSLKQKIRMKVTPPLMVLVPNQHAASNMHDKN